MDSFVVFSPTSPICSRCPFGQYETGKTESWCADKACSVNGNAFNFKSASGLCAWKTCPDGVWAYSTKNGPCTVYHLAGMKS